MKKPTVLLGIIILAASAFGAGWTSRGNAKTAPDKPASDPQPIGSEDERYPYVRPLLGCAISENKEFREFSSLEQKIYALIDERKVAGDAQDASVYFRDLATGRWTGVNEDAEYAPASMLKVPTMIAYLKLAEERPDILTQKIALAANSKLTDPQEIPPTRTLKVGGTYTIAELIHYMIVYSDNNATLALDQTSNILGADSFDEVASDLGVHSKDVISPKQFTLFFRTLYNGTYLNHAMSNTALALLAATDFNDGLRAGVPENIQIAHKFGQAGDVKDGVKTRELHDCGIVYAERPYALCVMTRGKSLAGLKRTIQDVSKLVYENRPGP